jgi:hypothetical protein
MTSGTAPFSGAVVVIDIPLVNPSKIQDPCERVMVFGGPSAKVMSGPSFCSEKIVIVSPATTPAFEGVTVRCRVKVALGRRYRRPSASVNVASASVRWTSASRRFFEI